MINAFIENISREKFFKDGSNFKISRKSDFISYPEFIRYFKELNHISRHNLIIGINFVYGWMPTIFKFREGDMEEALRILNNAKSGIVPKISQLQLLKALLNNSLVGTSKLLHFINPNVFAIWDSRVYRYLMLKEPNVLTIGDCKNYLGYIELCSYITNQREFGDLQKSMQKKVTYSITPYRMVELVMYSNGKKLKLTEFCK